MRLLFGSCFTFLIAAVLGLGATWFTLTRGVAFGSLSDRRLDGVAEKRIGRYRSLRARQHRAQRRIADRNGRRRRLLCPHRRPGKQFRRPLHLHHQRHDAGGALLDGHAVRSARAGWSPTRSIGTASPATRSSATATATSRITVAPLARAGNWLPTGGIEQFVLVWRLYDTPIGVATRTTKEGPMPAIARKGC